MKTKVKNGKPFQPLFLGDGGSSDLEGRCRLAYNHSWCSDDHHAYFLASRLSGFSVESFNSL